MAGKEFRLEITSQSWMGPFEDGSRDTSSHGGIRAVMAGSVITSEAAEYGIIQSALSLIRSLEHDHPTQYEQQWMPMPAYLLGHDCGFPLGLGCTNFGTDWTVRHDGDEVVLSNPLLIDAAATKRFDITVRIPLPAYRREIVAFAAEARRFYFAEGPRTVGVLDRDLYERFWAEFDERFARVRRAVASP